MLLSEAFTVYRDEVIYFTNQSPKTAEIHEITLQHLIRLIGDIPVCDLEFTHVMKLKTKLEEQGRSQNTIRLYIIRLRNVIHYLNKKGIDCISYEIITVPKRIDTAPKAATEEEISLMINSTGMLRNKALISLMYSSGARVSEICRLDISDIRDDKFTVYGKGNKNRICFIDQRAKIYLDEYLSKRTDNHPTLFLNREGGRMTPGKVQEVFKYVRKSAGITKPITPHSMRHSYATNLLKNGCHLYTLSRLMGHASTQTTATYLSLENPELQEAYKRFHT